MSLCINPSCPQPAHPNNSHTLTCQACGSELLLQGQYRVMRLLSKNSGFGLVYEAYQRDIPKILKVLKPERSENSKVLRLFRKEAEVLSQLNHAGVPLVEPDGGYFIYHPQDSPAPLHCIIMEKIDGLNLLQWMQQQGNHPIGEPQAFQWLFQLAEILRRVHQHNYFHRDIKPDNIMLRSSGQLVLVDFGAAREMSQTYLAQVGSLGVTTISSAGYTPPEQEQGQAVPQSDFYALGRTIVYLLTGRSPNDTTLYDPMLNAFNWRPHAPDLSDEFATLLDSLISPRVIDRPRTAQELLDRLHQMSLNRFVQQSDVGVLQAETSLPRFSSTEANGFRLPGATQPQASSAPSHAANTAASRVTYWTWLIAGGTVLLAIALIGLGVWSRQRSHSARTPSAPTTTPSPDTPQPPIPETRVELLRTFTGHQNSINALKLLSDGRRFVSASADNTIRLWDLRTGEALQTFTGHQAFVNAIALSPDERTFYSGSADGALLVWDTGTSSQRAEFAGHAGPVNALDRTPDGRYLVSAASDGTIKVWDTNTQALITTLEGHNGAVNAVLVSDDGQRIISGGTDQTIRIWDWQTGETIGVLEDHDSYINAIAISLDGRFLFSASADQTIKRWDLNSGEVLDTLVGHTSFINVLSLSRDGQTVASGSADSTIRQWDVASGELLAVYTGFGMTVDHMLLSTDQRIITASRKNSAIKAWLTDDP